MKAVGVILLTVGVIVGLMHFLGCSADDDGETDTTPDPTVSPAECQEDYITVEALLEAWK